MSETTDEADRERAHALLRVGWHQPRWYEFWRWREPKLPGRVLFYLGYFGEDYLTAPTAKGDSDAQPI
jgi:hypothetical protein